MIKKVVDVHKRSHDLNTLQEMFPNISQSTREKFYDDEFLFMHNPSLQNVINVLLSISSNEVKREEAKTTAKNTNNIEDMKGTKDSGAVWIWGSNVRNSFIIHLR
jgi:hypothetical protein